MTTPLNDGPAGPTKQERTTPRRTAGATIIGIATMFLVVCLDQVSKWAVVKWVSPHDPVPVIGQWFRLYLVRNPGAAFSMGTDATAILALVQLTAVIVCLILARRASSTTVAVIIGLIGGGAAGNLIDRIFRAPGGLHGHVVDFLSFGNFAIFNVADSAITVGVVLFLVHEFVFSGKLGGRE